MVHQTNQNNRTSRLNRYDSATQSPTQSPRGSALIITVMIIAVLSSISFSVTALTISEFRKTATLQDGIAAYYTAEAGIEHGLMQYRLWRDAEIGENLYSKVHSGQTLSINDSPLDSCNKDSIAENDASCNPQTFRLDGFVDIDNNKIDDGPGFVSPNPSSTADRGNSWYDLKLWYKAPYIGDIDASGNPIISSKSQLVSRDSAVQFNVRGIDKIKLRAEAVNPSEKLLNDDKLDLGNYAIEYSLSTLSNLSNEKITRDLFGQYVIENGQSIIDLPTLAAQNKITNAEQLRLKPLAMDAAKYSLTMQKDGNNVPIDANVSYIEATGYAGKAKRRLRIGIHRSSGTILEVGDFVLFSGDKVIDIP